MAQPPTPAELPPDQIRRGPTGPTGPGAPTREPGGAPGSAPGGAPGTRAGKRRGVRLVALLAALGVLAVLAVGAILSSRGGTEPTAPPDRTAADQQAYEQALVLLRAEPRREADDPYAKGALDAPVVLVEFADYRCPFCARHAQQVDPELQRYVEEGTLRVEWRDLPVFGAESVPVHVAARAAAQQGLFWEYHDAIFAASPIEGHRSWSPEELDALAESVGVPDLDRFRADRTSPELAAQVEADRAHAVDELGITATPGFILGDSYIPGAYPLATFVDLIEAAGR